MSSVGYVTQTHNISKTNTALTFVMKEDEVAVEDVVVTGYGNIKRESFTGQATVVTQEELLRVSPTNILAALQVFDPSIQIVENNEMGSDPNTLPQMQVRGQSSISGATELDVINGTASEYDLANDPNCPLFILDGYETTLQTIYDMDPMLIKSVTILKDAASTAVYGSRASNGVIVFESVPPKAGKIDISYNFTGSVTAPDLSSYNLMNAQQKLDAEVAAGLIMPTGQVTTYTSFDNRIAHYRDVVSAVSQGIDTYWLSYPLTTEINHKHSLGFTGGSEGFRFSLNVNYGNNNGVMKDSFRETMGVSLNLNYKMSEKLRVSNNISYSKTNNSNSSYGSFSDYTSLQPYWYPYDLTTGEFIESFSQVSGADIANPLYVQTLDNYSIGDYFTITNNFNLDYYINKYLRLTGSLAVSYGKTNSETYVDPDDPSMDNYDMNEKGRLSISDGTTTSMNGNVVLQYNRNIGKNNINLRLGGNMRESTTETTGFVYRGFSNSLLIKPMYAAELYGDNVTMSDSVSRLVGAFLSGNYSYDNIYLFDISARLDGSSSFGSNNKYAPFWSLGAGINFHNYDFMKSVDLFSSLRLTANYGQTGQVNFSPYMAYTSYQIQTSGWHTTGLGAELYSRGNSDLAWEKTNSLSVAFDATMLNSRLNVGLSYYNNTTIELVTDATLPLSTGFTSYKENVGKVENIGTEFRVSYAVIKKKDMGLNVGVTGSRNKNTILEISESQKAYNDSVNEYFEENSSVNTTPLLKYTEGGSLTSIYGVQSLGISPSTGEELFLSIDGSATTTWNSTDQTIIGNTQAKLRGSMTLNFYYKNFTLFTSFMYKLGGQVYNSTLASIVEGVNILSTNADLRVLTDRWKNTNDYVAYRALGLVSLYNSPTSRFIQDESYLKFNSVSLSYTLNKEWLNGSGISNCRLTANMSDVFTLSTVKQERGTSYPFARTFNLSANITF